MQTSSISDCSVWKTASPNPKLSTLLMALSPHFSKLLVDNSGRNIHLEIGEGGWRRESPYFYWSGRKLLPSCSTSPFVLNGRRGAIQFSRPSSLMGEGFRMRVRRFGKKVVYSLTTRQFQCEIAYHFRNKQVGGSELFVILLSLRRISVGGTFSWLKMLFLGQILTLLEKNWLAVWLLVWLLAQLLVLLWAGSLIASTINNTQVKFSFAAKNT